MTDAAAVIAHCTAIRSILSDFYSANRALYNKMVKRQEQVILAKLSNVTLTVEETRDLVELIQASHSLYRLDLMIPKARFFTLTPDLQVPRRTGL